MWEKGKQLLRWNSGELRKKEKQCLQETLSGWNNESKVVENFSQTQMSEM